MSYLNWICMLSAYILFFTICPFASGEEISINTFCEQATTSWNRYLNSLKTMKVVYYSETRSDTSAVERSPKYTIYNKYPNSLVLSNSSNDIITATGINKEYSFSLSTNDEKNWKILDVEKRHNTIAKDLSFPLLAKNKTEQDASQWQTSHLAVAVKLNFFVWLPPYFADKDFQILKAEECFENNLRMIKVNYRFEPKAFDPDIPLRSGEIFFIPNQLWAIKKAQFDYIEPDGKTRLNCSVSIDYGPTASEIPLPSTVTLLVNEPGKGYNNFSMKWFYSWSPNCDIDDDYFTLSHFGLSEPDFNEKRFNRVRFLLFISGLLLSSYAIWKIISHKRKSSTKDEYRL